MFWLSQIPFIGELSGWAWPTATFPVNLSFLEHFQFQEQSSGLFTHLVDKLILSRWPESRTVSTAPRSPEQEITAGPSHLEHKGRTDVEPYSGECDWDVPLFASSSLLPLENGKDGMMEGKDEARFQVQLHPIISYLSPLRNPSPVVCFQSCPGV